MDLNLKNDRRIGGIKAKRLLGLGENSHSSNKEKLDEVCVILVISPWSNRIINVLQGILKRGGKKITLTGVELYRQALARLNSDLANRVVALVITDRPDDYKAPARGNKPLWKEAIVHFQQNYLEGFAKEIGQEIFPPFLTVITMFKSHKGKLNEAEIQQLEKEFYEFKKENQFKNISCENEEELQNVVDKEIIDMVLKQQRQRDQIKKYERSRQQKIAKAKTITKNAHKKFIFNKD